MEKFRSRSGALRNRPNAKGPKKTGMRATAELRVGAGREGCWWIDHDGQKAFGAEIFLKKCPEIFEKKSTKNTAFCSGRIF